MARSDHQLPAQPVTTAPNPPAGTPPSNQTLDGEFVSGIDELEADPDKGEEQPEVG